jgi:hypothetical protein
MKITGIAGLVGLFLCAWPANAQQEKEYLLTVAIHKDVRPLTPNAIEGLLKNASDLMRRNNCPVKFKLKYPIWTFTTTPPDVVDASSLEAVHSIPADIKVVRSIKFCKGRYQRFEGCAWRPSGFQETIVVRRDPRVAHPYQLWTHEFGHTTGLPHRLDDDRALMTPCAITTLRRKISREECQCFLAGPGGCIMPPVALLCPPQQKRGFIVD